MEARNAELLADRLRKIQVEKKSLADGGAQ